MRKNRPAATVVLATSAELQLDQGMRETLRDVLRLGIAGIDHVLISIEAHELVFLIDLNARADGLVFEVRKAAIQIVGEDIAQGDQFRVGVGGQGLGGGS